MGPLTNMAPNMICYRVDPGCTSACVHLAIRSDSDGRDVRSCGSRLSWSNTSAPSICGVTAPGAPRVVPQGRSHQIRNTSIHAVR